MTVTEIKEAVDSGLTVHWQNAAYKVVKDSKGQYLIECINGSYIGLTYKDGLTLNGDQSEFFIKN